MSIKSDKFQLITKPTQSGKTFVVLNEIKKILVDNEDSNSDKRIINILFCDNSLLQTEQLKYRMDNEIKLFIDYEGNSSAILSSNSDVNNYSSLFTIIFDDDCDNIITCANDSRIDDIDTLISKQLKKNSNIIFYIWIDESDKTFSSKIDVLYKWSKYNNIEKISLITATPESHFKNNFSEINIYKLDNAYNDENYQLFKDCNFIYLNHEQTNILDNIKYTFNTYNPQKGSVWFLPGSTKQTSHNNIKDVACSIGFYTFLINGNEKCLFDPNGNILDLIESKNDDELSKILASLYKKHSLKDEIVGITGHLCISRGITISSEEMFITHAIIPPYIKNKSSAYQLVGRLCGNYKKYSNYLKPTIYIFPKIKEQICKMEEIAIKISSVNKLSFDDYFKLKVDKTNVLHERFRDFKNLLNYVGKNMDILLYGAKPKNRFKIKDSKGFFMTNIRSIEKVYTYEEVINNINWGINKKNKYRIHVCYEDLNKLESLFYVLAYIDPKELVIKKDNNTINSDNNINNDNIINNDSNSDNESINNSKENDNINKDKKIKERPKDINIFNSDTIIRHKHKLFTEYAIYIKDNEILYLCDENGIPKKDEIEIFKTFNKFTVRNYKKYASYRTFKNSAYTDLDYYNNLETKFIRMKDIYKNNKLN
jgi:hypothetical protein